MSWRMDGNEKTGKERWRDDGLSESLGLVGDVSEH